MVVQVINFSKNYTKLKQNFFYRILVHEIIAISLVIKIRLLHNHLLLQPIYINYTVKYLLSFSTNYSNSYMCCYYHIYIISAITYSKTSFFWTFLYELGYFNYLIYIPMHYLTRNKNLKK